MVAPPLAGASAAGRVWRRSLTTVAASGTPPGPRRRARDRRCPRRRGGYLSTGNGERCDVCRGGAAAAVAAGTAAAAAAAASPAAPAAAVAAATRHREREHPAREPGAHGKITISYLDPSTGWVDLTGGGTMTSAPTVVLRPAGLHPAPTHDVFYLDAQQPGRPARGHRRRTRPRAQPRRRALPRLHRRRPLARRRNASTSSAAAPRARCGTRPSPSPTAGAPGPPAPQPAPSPPTPPSPRQPTRLDVFFRGTDNRLSQLTAINGTWAAPDHRSPAGPR